MIMTAKKRILVVDDEMDFVKMLQAGFVSKATRL
jgi:hypothetical protein